MTLYQHVFKTAHRYPLAEQLKTLVGKDNPPRANSASTRMTSDIVSPSLCDDVLQYIAPSLEAHRGCDIIDLHPGACLWSQKLHEAVRPRRHLLMEPNAAYFEPFIKPLLDRPGSAYRHTSLSGAHPQSYWSAYAHIFNDDLLPGRAALDAGDPRLREANRTLLVTGCLHRAYKGVRKALNSVDYPTLILNHMVQAAQTNTLFHAWGLVRMLFWVPEATRDQAHTVNLHGRNPLSTCIDSVADVTQVVAHQERPPKLDSLGRRRRRNRVRSPEIDEYSLALTVERMAKAGKTVPKHRRSMQLEAALERPGTDRGAIFSLTDDADLGVEVEEHRRLLGRFREELAAPRQKGTGSKRPSSAGPGSFSTVPGYTLPEDAKITLSYETLHSKLTAFASLSHRQTVLEYHFCKRDASLPTDVSSGLGKALLETAKSIRELQSSIHGRPVVMSVVNLLEEERALRSEPAIVPNDRRTLEPLLTSPDEFWPAVPLSLLDISPRPRNLASDITSAAEGNAVMRELAQTLMMRPREDVAKALDRIAPNAGRDLVDATPGIRDVVRGGRLDPRDLTARCLSRDMFLDLVEAFLEWPFRPTTVELAVSQAAGAGMAKRGDGDGEEDEDEDEMEEDDDDDDDEGMD